MANLAQALKNEISRIAKRESKAIVEPFRKANAELRNTVTDLRRRHVVQEREIAQLRKQIGKSSAAAGGGTTGAEGKAAARHRISAKGIKSLREKLGLSAERLAGLVGVSGQTIYLWERGKTSPRAKPLAALVKLRTMGKKEVDALLATQGETRKTTTPKKPAKPGRKAVKKTVVTKDRRTNKTAAKSTPKAAARKTPATKKPPTKRTTKTPVATKATTAASKKPAPKKTAPKKSASAVATPTAPAVTAPTPE